MHRLLRRVSRSFYLTIRVLPSAIRPQIGTAYLLARATDTIADTELVPVSVRVEALAGLRDSILAAADGKYSTIPDFRGIAGASAVRGSQGAHAERTLLLEIGSVLGDLREFTADDRHRIRDVLETITSGQTMDLERFGAAIPGCIATLKTEGELEDYAYRVAGCVGEFWTRMCRAHLFPRAALDDAFLIDRGIRFGKGLQYVNVLRDLPRDLRRGRCYLPAEELERVGLRPESLLDPNSMPYFRSLYHTYLDRAVAYLTDGWEYTGALPRNQMRVRLGCAWPALIGIRTVAQLRRTNVLDDEQRIKISRRDVRAIMLRSILRYPFPLSWNRLFSSWRQV